MILTYCLLITSELIINCNCNGLQSYTLYPPENEPCRLRAGSFTVVSADHQSYDRVKWVMKAGRLLVSKKDKSCDRTTMTSGRSLVKITKNYKNDVANGTYIVINQCDWQPKLAPSFKQNYCLGVREPNPSDKKTRFGGAPKYLIWNYLSVECTHFYITAPYENEQDMFNIFYQQDQDDYFYSPSCCFIANDNVNIPLVDDGLTMCECTQQHIDIIEGKPVIKKDC